jgi:transcriptional regulator with XRE-family HTH domain
VVSTAVRSWLVPPERWMVELLPPPETFGSEIRRLRLARGWSQREVAQRTGIDQTEISKYERDAYRHRKPDVVVAYEDAFGLTRGELAHLPWGDARRNPPAIPGPSVAIPDEPPLLEAVRALFLLEPDELPAVADHIRLIAKGPIPRPAEEEQAG